MNPITILFFLFLAIPLVEIYLLIKVGGLIGAPWTIFLVVFTAVLGAWLIRLQGFSTLRRIQQILQQGGLPAVELIEGAVLLVAGALLLTPGFFTDTIGFLCLIPALRRAFIKRALQRFIIAKGQRGEFDAGPFGERTPHTHKQQHHTHTIEGEYTRDDD